MMDEEKPFVATLLIEEGRISGIIPGFVDQSDSRLPRGADFFDASGLYMAPGFIDIHIHDEYKDAERVAERSLLRQGITTALFGNCGLGLLFGESVAMHVSPWIHLYGLIGNCALRGAAGQTDRYAPATDEQIIEMARLLRESMSLGAMGISLGLEYEPGASADEINCLARVAAEFDGIVTVHQRYDDDRCVDSVREIIDLARMFGVRVEISHLGSMTPYHTGECVDIIDAARSDGLKVTFDCYPYAAFCTNIGSAIFDDGFVERWHGKGPEYLESISGRFRGRRLDWDTFKEMRNETPDGLVVAHIMEEAEVAGCIANPNCIIGSDTFYRGEGAHPRMSGTFPRAFRMAMKTAGYEWKDVLKKATTMPADVLGIDAGRLYAGCVADVTVFDPERYVDRATYQEPFLPPDGVELVVVNGEIAVRGGVVTDSPHGALHLRPAKRRN
jgi:N-acyl-D-amino-acid deacylase